MVYRTRNTKFNNTQKPFSFQLNVALMEIVLALMKRDGKHRAGWKLDSRR
jgi:hypothetical protein